jgi:hypothetical protein
MNSVTAVHTPSLEKASKREIEDFYNSVFRKSAKIFLLGGGGDFVSPGMSCTDWPSYRYLWPPSAPDARHGGPSRVPNSRRLSNLSVRPTLAAGNKHLLLCIVSRLSLTAGTCVLLADNSRSLTVGCAAVDVMVALTCSGGWPTSAAGSWPIKAAAVLCRYSLPALSTLRPVNCRPVFI